MSYFKLLGYNVSKKLTGSANSLFSTAVISGSSSAPNLKDMVPPHASAVAAIEGFGGVPPIRPLETLHNALSLRQLDCFLEMMTTAPLYRTPASSPPKSSPAGSTHESLNPPLGHPGIVRDYHHSDPEAVRYITPTPIQYKSLGEAEACMDLRNLPSPTSPNSTGWSSEPQSFLSSEPSSPAPTSTGECSMSISLISNEGAQLFSTASKFSPAPCLDVDFNEFCMRLDQENRESRGSVSYTDYYSNEDGQIRKITQIPSSSGGGGVGSSVQMYDDDDTGNDNVDDDEDHTLTLKQSEEQRKQDVKSIFEQREDVNPAKLSASCKKIGRFRVESTDISHGDVRIKETDNAGNPHDRTKSSSASQRSDSNAEKTRKDSKKNNGGGGSHASSQKRKNFSRSQSVTAPKPASPKPEATFSYSKQSSFSMMSDADLENWKLSMDPTTAAATPCSSETNQPILTVASSLTDSSNVTMGFDVKEEKKD